MTVADFAFRRPGHFSAEELVADVGEGNRSRVSKATVYRTLSLLAEAGFLDSQDFGQGCALYEHTRGVRHHDHLVCMRCRRIVEFTDEEVERLQETVARRFDFHILFHSHKLFGVCAACRSARPHLPAARVD